MINRVITKPDRDVRPVKKEHVSNPSTSYRGREADPRRSLLWNTICAFLP